MKHYLMLLDAEDAALNKKINDAHENYRKSIIHAGRSGELHHAGMFNERYADFLLTICNDTDEARYRLEEAIRYYKDWRAPGKVAEMEEIYERLPRNLNTFSSAFL